jgi:tRNA threonylcarbamoyladenosine modification (KEOPS) complex  Pcc1 subunit
MKSDKKALTSLTVGGVTKPYAGSGTQFDLPFGTQAVPLAGAHTGVSIGFSSYTLAAETTATASATVTAEDGTTAQYPFKLYVKSGNANLTANPTWLGTSPTTVGYDVSSILVTATPVFSRATVTYNGSANPRVPLVVGDNSVTVVVTAEDTAISRTYGPYQIRRQSDNTNLAAVFVASKVEYTWTGNAYTGTAIRVGHLDFNIVPLETAAIAEIVELVTVEPPTYAIVNPATYVAGQTYNKFIRVSAEDRTKIEYYPITFRTLSNNVALTSVAINGVVPFPPIVVPYATASIPVSASAANGATVVISGIVDGRVPLVVGDNTIVITVTAEDHVMTHAYSYTVRRRSNVADISGLIIGGTPVDNLAAVRGGTAIVTVSSITSSVAVQATPSHPRASVTNINGHLSLFPGDNDVRFTIRAEDGNVIEYYITVRRAATNTKLAEVTINNVPISVSAIRTGTAYIKTKRSVNVFVETQDPNALATYVLSNPLVDGSGNQLHITVKAEDRDISANYTVKVDILSNITSLSSFVINGTPVSHGGRFQVGPRVTSVKVVATAAHSAATLAIAGHEQLRPGLNTVTVTATAEDGTIQEHKVTVQVGPTTPEPVGQGPTAPLTYTDDQDRVDRLAGSYILSTYRRWNRVADYDTYLRMKRFLNR